VLNARENGTGDTKPVSKHDVHVVGKLLAQDLSFGHFSELVYHNPEVQHTPALPTAPSREAAQAELDEIKRTLRAKQPAAPAEEPTEHLPSIPTLLDALARRLGRLFDESFRSYSRRLRVSPPIVLGQVKQSANSLARLRTRAGVHGEAYAALVTTSTTLRSSRHPLRAYASSPTTGSDEMQSGS
jgi:hypothetical protein